MLALQLHTRGTSLLEAWVSSRFSVKCTLEAISGRSAGSDLPQRKSGLQERTRLDRQTLPQLPSIPKRHMVYQNNRFLKC